MTQKAQSEIRRLTGYALCRALMRRAADVIEETHIETATQYERRVR